MREIKKMSREELRKLIENEAELFERLNEYTAQQQQVFIEILVMIGESFETQEDFESSIQRHINKKITTTPPAKEMCL